MVFATRSSCSNGGFAYVALLIALAVIGIAAAASLQIGATMHRRAAEAELLSTGAELQRALDAYTQAGGAPLELDDLLRDPRVPGARRYLRRIPIDPLTGKREWAVIRDPFGRIAGVHSLATSKPIKSKNFPAPFAHFENAKSYADWRFGTALVITPTVDR